MRCWWIIPTFLLALAGCSSQKSIATSDLFDKSNVIPWSIVAFDSLKRTPAQRVAMIKRLGFTQYAFGGRQQHIDRMEEEIEIARDNDIKISAVWLYLHHEKDSVGHLKSMSEQVFDALKQTGLSTEIWVGFTPEYFDGLDDESAFAKAEKMIDYLAQRAAAVNCTIALYNHGGWYGDPKHQVEIVKRLPQHQIGIVYNFHHAQEELEAFHENIALLLPYLSCINLNSMQAGGPKIMTIGTGNLEKQMIDRILELGYTGPFGILGHVKGGDPEVLLDKNYNGLIDLMR